MITGISIQATPNITTTTKIRSGGSSSIRIISIFKIVCAQLRLICTDM